ncbi:Alpha/Beta hydrolase protein [Aspergillus floccosus]
MFSAGKKRFNINSASHVLSHSLHSSSSTHQLDHQLWMLGRWTSQRLGRHLARTSAVRPVPRQLDRPLSRRVPQTPHQASGAKQNILGSRSLFTAAIPPILVPPVLFVGLLLGLWTWKCFWIIVMQDKLLYLSWLPPFTRSETVQDYAAECKPVQWEEKQIQSLDGTKLAVCEGRIPTPRGRHNTSKGPLRKVVICYFQGNGGSTPMRLPLLSQVLRTMRDSKTTTSSKDIDYIITTLSYRGYWTSSGRATQSGIERDAQAFLNWVAQTYTEPDVDLQIILWGHSLGSAVASTALATYLSRGHDAETPTQPPLRISGMVMEAPTSSIKDMLISLYPQKWLPYRYLWPFSWNNWDNTTAMKRMAQWRDQKNSTADGKRRGNTPLCRRRSTPKW